MPKLAEVSRDWLSPLLVVGVLGTVAWAANYGNPTVQDTVLNAFILIIFVVGLHLFIGLSGVFSFGHLAFAAIGAYTAALLTIPPNFKEVILPDLPDWLAAAHPPMPVAVLTGGVLAAVVAGLAGVAIMRLIGPAASIATLAVLFIVRIAIGEASSFTGGYSALTGVPELTMRSAFVFAAAAVLIGWKFQESALGLRMKAARENEAAARAGGINVVRDRLVGFVVSAFFLGVGGALYGQYLGAFSPDAFYLKITFLTVAMLVVGGLGSLSGAVIGCVLLTALSEFLRQAEGPLALGMVRIDIPQGLAEVVLALLVLLILILRPSGITGGREVGRPAPQLRTHAGAPELIRRKDDTANLIAFAGDEQALTKTKR